MQSQWTITEAGGDLFTILDDYKCSDSGILYILDRKLFKIFLFDKNGKFLSSFGKHGEGPQEFATLRNLFPIDKFLIVVDDRNIHYYSEEGKYIKSVLNNHIKVSPVSFITPDRFISVTIFAADNNIGTISLNDLGNQKSKILFEFPIWKQGSITTKRVEGDMTYTSSYSYSVSNLTPGMVLFHSNDKIYFGINNDYKIRISNLDGKELIHFTLERKKNKASSEYKDRIVNGFGFPDDVKKQIRKLLPDYLNYFEKIYVDENGFIYIFSVGEDGPNIKNIDIFSDEGSYLYSSKVTIEEGYSIKNIYIKDHFMYINILRDDDVLITKYKIVLPGK